MFRVRRWSFGQLVTLVLMVGCAAGPTKPPRDVAAPPKGPRTVPSPSPKASAPGLGRERIDSNPDGSLTASPLGSPATPSKPPPSRAPLVFLESAPPPSQAPFVVTPTRSPGPVQTGAIQYTNRQWVARVLAGGNHGTPTNGTGTAAVLGQDLTQLAGMAALPPFVGERLYFNDPSAKQLRSLDLDTPGNAACTVRLELGSPARIDDSASNFPPGLLGLRTPTGMAHDSQGRLLFGELLGHRIWRYARESFSAATVTTVQNAPSLAGGDRNTVGAYADGAGSAATLSQITGMAADGDLLYFADQGFHSLRQADTAQSPAVVSFLAGAKGDQGATLTARPDPAFRANARFGELRGLAFGTMPAGAVGPASSLAGKKCLLAADARNHCIWGVDLSTESGQVYVVAGTCQAGSNDGALDSAQMTQPIALAWDAEGFLYFSEGPQGAPRVRVINFVRGRIETLMGEATAGSSIQADPAASPPRTKVFMGHVTGLAVVNSFPPTKFAAKLLAYDQGAPADLENPAANAGKAGPRLLEVFFLD